jgi:hypothetical protein
MPLYPSTKKFYVPFSLPSNSSQANGSAYNILSFESTSGLITPPSFASTIKIGASILFQTNPVAQTFDLRVTGYGTQTGGAPFSPAITQTLTCTPESNNGSNSWRFELTMATPLSLLTLPAGAKTVADRVGFWTLALAIINNSGGTLATVSGVWSRGLAVFE